MRTHKDLDVFLNYATGSLSELETQTIIAHNLKYLDNEQKQEIDTIFRDIFKMLSKLIQSLKEKNT